MKRLLVSAIFIGCALPALACVSCNKTLREAIFNHEFMPNLLVVLIPFIVLAVVVAILIAAASKRSAGKPSIQPLVIASTVIGMGVGGFIDGIILHQILQ